MKKAITFLLAFSALLSLTACGGTTGTDTSKNTTEAITDPLTESQDTAPTTDAATTGKDDNMPLAYTVTDNRGDNGIDFILDFEAGRDLRILQMTDTQIQWLDGARPERFEPIKNTFFGNGVTDHETRVWQHMDRAVDVTKPDFIVLTGDNIYGEMDDSGTVWDELCTKMDSYGIPWLTVFGNHDNESAKGVQWQVDRLLASEHCIFRQGNVTGNSNYTVLLTQNGQPLNLMILFDTNGCVVKAGGEGLNPDNVDLDKVCQAYGPQDDQIAWIKASAEAAFDHLGVRVPVSMFFHIPPIQAAGAVDTKYPGKNGNISNSTMPFRPNQEGDLGEAREGLGGFYHPLFWSTAKEIGVTDMFVGHQHKVATSIVDDGIRITYGLKTGTYDYYSPAMLGCALATVSSEGSLSIQYFKHK
jgi:hypothetical protein